MANVQSPWNVSRIASLGAVTSACCQMPKMNSFWTTQLSTAWQDGAGQPALTRVSGFARFARELLSKHHSASDSPLVGGAIPADEKLTVIVLNHKRPQNVGQIARYTLRSGFVGRMIVSNNSQAYRMADYVTVQDPRLLLIDQPEPSGVGISLEIAHEHRSRYYLRVDDDIFLHPAQLQWIYWNLRICADRPHGIFGAAFDSGKDATQEWPFVHRRNVTAPIEILNGLFAFTREHLDEYFRLCGLLGINNQRTLMNGEDIVLSFSGSLRPMIHHIGPIWECASEAKPGVALHQSRPRFYEERWKLYSALQLIKPLEDAAAPPEGIA